jgi:hypothetical protein
LNKKVKKRVIEKVFGDKGGFASAGWAMQRSEIGAARGH